jgi:hypothetical protein
MFSPSLTHGQVKLMEKSPQNIKANYAMPQDTYAASFKQPV